MTEFISGALLILLLLALGAVWTYPILRKDACENRHYLMLRSGVYLAAGLVLLTLAASGPALDLLRLLRIIAGLVILYEGIRTILKIHTEMRRAKTREQGM